MISIIVKNGWFHQILGQSAQNGGFVFIPLLGDLGSELEIVPYQRDRETPIFPLSDYVEGQSLSFLEPFQDLFEEPVNAVWVRARIPAVFGSNILISLSVPDYKYGLVEQAFMACEPGLNGHWVAYPFICEAYNLCARLRFHADDSSIDVHKRIAKAFWELLLLEAECVCAFRDCYLHYNDLGDKEWHCLMFKHGRFSIERFSIEIINPAFW